MECPLKRLGSALLAAGAEDAVIESFKIGIQDKKCDSECAWYMDGKCALAVLAAKES